MMPAYRSMDSHPYHRNQMAFPHYYQPGNEGIHPQMNVDPPKSHFAHEQPWPYVGSYGYPTPMKFCCGHHKFPSYCTYKPAYPHIPAPSPMYFSGCCPAYSEPFYAPYAPPPHYTMELPRYEYDKCMPTEYHCCGCPNHPLSPKEESNVKIEEHEPDVEKKVNNTVAPSQLKNYSYPFVWFPPKYMVSGDLTKPVTAEVGDPDAEKKMNNAVAPTQLKNYAYPIVWIPPQYMHNKELKKPDAAEVGEQDRISHDRKPSEYCRADGQEPKVWNGWFPLDINSLANRIQDGNVRRNNNWQNDNSKRESKDESINQSQQSERNKREFPVIWIPSSNIQEGERTNNQESSSSPNSIEEVPHALKSAPVISCSSDDVSNKSNVKGNDSNMSDLNTTRRETNEKGIPLKHMEQQKRGSEGHERRVRDIPVKQTEGNMNGKESQTNVKIQPDSPKKTSKLPPVCLRVDPLPWKKNGNGSSRSPSPSKEHSKAAANGTSKAFTSSSTHEKAQADAKLQNASNVSGDDKPREKTIKVVDMSSGKKDKERRDGSESHDEAQEDLKLQNYSSTTQEVKPKNKTIKVLQKPSEKKHEDQMDGSQSQITSNMTSEVQENSSTLTRTQESCKNGKKINENEAERKVNDMIKEEAIESREARGTTETKVLADTEAAVLIQAAYRGFQVRKWEPLKKLKQIAEVSERVTEVRGSIQALETSNNQIDEKERVTTGETIMGLLLKLDTIQGLHPSFREMRKSLARELTSLQEKLDSIPAKKSQQQMDDLSVREVVEETSQIGSNGECMQEQPEDRVSSVGKDSTKGNIHESHDLIEQQTEEGIAAPEMDSSDNMIHVSEDMVEQCQDQPFMKNRNSSHKDEKLQSVVHGLPGDDDKCKSSSPVGAVFEEEAEPLPKETVNEDGNHVSTVEASGSGISETQHKVKSELEDIPTEVHALDMKAWEELPRGVIDDLEVDLDKENETERKEPQVSGITTASGDRYFPTMVDDFAQDGACSKIPEMAELPVGLLDDDTATSDSEKHDETETLAHVLQTGEGECNAAPITGSSADDIISKGTQLEEQQVEQQEVVQSSEDSDDWVKIEFQKDEFKGDASLESGSREENDEQSVTAEFTRNDGQGVVKEVVCLEVKEVPIAETTEEEVALKEAQSEGGDTVAEQGINVVAQNREVSAEQKSEQAVTTPLPKEVPIPKQDGEMDTDKNLTEENEKLRKMMQKLLEAGNEQLTVISNLTGRVKDLEKKLARKKRVRTRHCRPTTSKKSANDLLQVRTTGVAKFDPFTRWKDENVM